MEDIIAIKKKYFSGDSIKVKDLDAAYNACVRMLMDVGFVFTATPVTTDGVDIDIKRIPSLDKIPEEYLDKEVPYGFYNIEDNVYTHDFYECFRHKEGEIGDSNVFIVGEIRRPL